LEGDVAAPQLLSDIALRFIRSDALSIYEVQDQETRTSAGGRVVRVRDLSVSSELDNLRQAIEIRLLTPKGELAALGHADFGSRLPDLIGQPNTETNRNLAKLYVIEALKQERRIEKIVSVEVTPAPGQRQLIRIFLQVKAIGVQNVIDLGPFTIDLT
jgi:phage baseplate assembly protein W